MDKIIRIGLDTSKNVFQLHGVNEAELPMLRRKLNRNQLLGFLAKLPPLEVGVEACGASHYWARCGSCATAICEALCQAGQIRCSRRRSDLRGHVSLYPN